MSSVVNSEDSEWISWADAAVLLGCPASTVEHHARLGHIQRRPHAGGRPTLNRASVLAFAPMWDAIARRRRNNGEIARYRTGEFDVDTTTWITLAEAAEMLGSTPQNAGLRARRHKVRSIRVGRLRYFDREQITALSKAAPRPRPRPPTSSAPVPQPVRAGWITLTEAAVVLERSRQQVRRLVRTGALLGELDNNHIWISPESVDELLADRARWISESDAAELLGCSVYKIVAAKTTGAIASRSNGRSASLGRESVLAYAGVLAREAAAEAARQQVRAGQAARRGPPDTQHEWLRAAGVATILGVSPSRVGQLARARRLPSTTTFSGGPRWFRRDLVYLYAAHVTYRRTREQSAIGSDY